MTRADRIAAALERWRIETEHGADMPSMPSVKAAGEALAALLRAALDDVARLTEEQNKEAQEWNDLRDRYDATVLELTQARAALATAEEAQAKAVDEEREACLSDIRAQAPPRDVRTVATEAQVSVLNHAIAAIRARAGRNDAG